MKSLTRKRMYLKESTVITVLLAIGGALVVLLFAILGNLILFTDIF
jgi:archaellum biogenesis protein FlaJ (TadC family)